MGVYMCVDIHVHYIIKQISDLILLATAWIHFVTHMWVFLVIATKADAHWLA